jgi:Flp pilus assembly pilin Flp
MTAQLTRFWNDEDGQDLIEYSLLITFIAIACMWFVGSGRNAVQGVWTSANTATTSAQSAANGS